MARPAARVSVSELVRQHYEPVYRYAYRLSGCASDAADVAQETFIRAQEKLDQLREPQRSLGWLMSIARNSYLQRCRQDRRAAELPLETLGELCDEPDEVVGVDEIDPEELQAALLELPEEFRSALVLFYFEEFSYREIAEHLEVPIGTVMSRLARGKAHLRRRLTRHFESEADSSLIPAKKK